ncbi:unnamed protein product [Chironomus riparius]|uniref:Uncharacterized protein n=1 Tax=Chironomus riparius TaxID=315576 RepID=A0A9N9S417_9DIPT|nr:unnamed protein product [Chironomus riparius]
MSSFKFNLDDSEDYEHANESRKNVTELCTESLRAIEKLSYKKLQLSSIKCLIRENIDMFPNLKHLQFESGLVGIFHVLKHASLTNVNLESLECVFFHSDILNSYSVYFLNLKELSALEIINETAFSSFISRHSKTFEKNMIDNASNITELTAN